MGNLKRASGKFRGKSAKGVTSDGAQKDRRGLKNKSFTWGKNADSGHRRRGWGGWEEKWVNSADIGTRIAGGIRGKKLKRSFQKMEGHLGKIPLSIRRGGEKTKQGLGVGLGHARLGESREGERLTAGVSRKRSPICQPTLRGGVSTEEWILEDTRNMIYTGSKRLNIRGS